MQLRYLTFAIFLNLAFAVQPVRPQAPAAPSPVCDAKFARLLVEQQAGESRSVSEPVKQIKILLRSADFLWVFDEVTARAYFAAAFKIANDRFHEVGFESTSKSGGLVITQPDQRTEVVRAIAVHDAKWARVLIEQIFADIEKSKSGRGFFDKDREIRDALILASQYAKTNPELSRFLFDRAMRYQLGSMWYSVLFNTAGTNQQLADEIYSLALRNYRNETPHHLLYLSAYPFGNSRIFGPDKFSMGTWIPDGFSPNVMLQRQFIDVLFSRTASFSTSVEDLNQATEKDQLPQAAYLVSAIREIEPVIIERFPDLLQRHSLAKAQAEALMNDQTRKQLEDREGRSAGQGKSFEEKLESLEKADADGKLTDYMIVNLVSGTLKTDEEFALVEKWIDKIKEQNPRKETANYYWFSRAKLAIKDRRYEDAERFGAKVPEIEHRAIIMFEMADIQIKNENDAAKVFDTLNSISKLARQADNSVAKAQTLLGIATLYERVNHSLALDELSEAVRVINQLKDPDILATSVTRQIVGKGFGFFFMFELNGNSLEKTFWEISKKDFELSLANARALDDKYFRTLAVIAVAGNCARNAPKPSGPKAKK